MTSQPTATSFALLGLLGVQPWTAYELVAQTRRSLHYFWPRSEANLYAELKRIVARGHAEAEVVEGGGRQRTRYTITGKGRDALEDWLATEPAPPSIQVEALLRMLLADQASVEDLRAAVATSQQQIREMMTGAVALGEDLLSTGGPFPERLHLTERVVALYGGFLELFAQWCEETSDEIDSWSTTRDIGLTSQGRQRMEQLVARAHEYL
ncbi:PadR family transcriptional regulator [Mycolicibacterium sp. P9-64]|uniref:PadR family transcriptional regulator n=1 Tax=Mycolicibacterium sp. P9-64 TaxID=2024612 RepID=UPI0011ECDBB7|nr:PadR family transcriptional regulator [Mycolicibacterium sp. P9-64]KAA0087075.1 PadR family transcriptional regulator [Mycolicibacterium sp. P9-64]